MDHYQEVVGSNPGTVHWMDIRDATSFYVIDKMEIKVAKSGTPKKK